MSGKRRTGIGEHPRGNWRRRSLQSGLSQTRNADRSRYANRLRNSTFTVDGVTSKISNNDHDGLNTLHGGTIGYDAREWKVVSANASAVTFSLMDYGFEGFPGNVVRTSLLNPTFHFRRVNSSSRSPRTPSPRASSRPSSPLMRWTSPRRSCSPRTRSSTSARTSPRPSSTTPSLSRRPASLTSTAS